MIGALALLVLSLVQATALLSTCGLRLESTGYLSLDFCPDSGPTGPSPTLAAELQRRATLEARLHDLERRLAGLPACTRVQEPPSPNVLDAERWEEQDIALLEGCWALASDHQFRHVRTGVVRRVNSLTMCFDAEGRGEQEFSLSDGEECASDVSASFGEDGNLRINDHANIQCSNNFFIFRRDVTCTLEPNGEADCESHQPETGNRSNMRIMRRESS